MFADRDGLLRDIDIPEHLPGEPPLPVRTAANTAWVIFTQLASVIWRSFWMVPLWPLYLVLRAALPRPPNIPSNGQLLQMLWLVATEQPPQGLALTQRILLVLFVLQRWSFSPMWGLAWFIDELLYGEMLKQIVIKEPLFELSAARSGSTQISHYLEDDPRIVAPPAMYTQHPYLWVWQIAELLFGTLIPKSSLRAFVASMYSPEFIQRHELDPFRTDTFEMQFVTRGITGTVMSLGPRATVALMGNSRLHPESMSLWREDFLNYFDAVCRKRLLLAQLAGHSTSRSPVRLMIKGHFLNVASELAQRYPDARFLTVVRSPLKRLQSLANFHRVQPMPPGIDAPRWSWLVHHLVENEIEYCEREMAWFEQPEGPHRTVVRFDDYVRDLAGTMRHVYRECMGLPEPSPHVPRTHAERDRSNYSIDRSLEDLGVNTELLAQRLQTYIRWCSTQRGDKKDPA